MTRVVFSFTRDSEVNYFVAELLDNPAALAWAYSVLLNDSTREPRFKHLAARQPYNADIANTLANSLRTTIKTLDNTPFKFTQPIPNVIDQKFLNVIHRHFTNSTRELWDDCWTDFENQQRYHEILQPINDIVHELEQYIDSDRRQHWLKQPHREIVLSSNGTGFDIKPFRQYHSLDSADVIMDAYILGKTLIESFMCDDDPTEWDTTGHIRTAGGCNIVLTDLRQQVYNSSEFNEWLKQYNTTREQVNGDIPLANFLPGEKERLKNFIEQNKQIKTYQTKIIIEFS